MKKLSIIILLTAVQFSFAQSFEGTLTYKCDFVVSPKMEKIGMTKQQMLDKMQEDGSWADTVRITYKGGNYYTYPNSKPESWSVYRADSNKIYSMQKGDASDICAVKDAAIDLEEKMTGNKPSFIQRDTVVDVNGVACNILSVKWKTGRYDYYYNSAKYVVDPSLYSKHVYDGWADFLKVSKALPIRIVKSVNGMMEVTMDLVLADTNKINDNMFVIPMLEKDDSINILKSMSIEMFRIKQR